MEKSLNRRSFVRSGALAGSALALSLMTGSLLGCSSGGDGQDADGSQDQTAADGAGETQEPAHVVINFTDGFAHEDRMCEPFREWADLLTEDTNGKLIIANVNTWHLGLNVETGGAGGFASAEEEAKYIPWRWCGWYVMFTDKFPLFEAINEWVYGTDLYGALYAEESLHAEFKELQDEYASCNLKKLGTFAAPGDSIQSRTKPVRSLKDLEGMVISNASGGFNSSGYPWMREYGAIIDDVPTDPLNEFACFKDTSIYVDATLSLDEMLEKREGADQVKYSTWLYKPYSPQDIFCMDLDYFNSLPKDIQEALDGGPHDATWFNQYMTEFTETCDQVGRKYAQEQFGTEFIEFSDEDKATLCELYRAQGEARAKELDEMGLPGTAMFTRCRELVEEYNKANGFE